VVDRDQRHWRHAEQRHGPQYASPPLLNLNELMARADHEFHGFLGNRDGLVLPRGGQLSLLRLTCPEALQQTAHDNGLLTHLFINVPAEDRAPGTVGDPVKSATLKEHLDEFNAVLAQHITAFKAANAGASIPLFSTTLN
jgi:hypothetical protein